MSLDYFLARYYSSNQGRFTSPDEFTGGPAELFHFAEIAAQNPTFYADFTNPQSLNKYQYTYNNPVNLTDATGHCPPCISQTHRDINTGVVMELGNTIIGMNNLMADFKIGNAKHGEYFQPLNTTQEAAMKVTSRVLLFGALAFGRPQVGGVAAAEAESAAVTASRVSAANEAAINTANQVQQLSGRVRPGAAGAATATTGQTFTTVSGQAKHHPVVREILDSVPQGQRGPQHGKCCEPKLVSQVVNAGVDPRGRHSAWCAFAVLVIPSMQRLWNLAALVNSYWTQSTNDQV